MRLLIISDMAHYCREGQLVGWGPTVEEINHLSVLFDQIKHIGCLHEGPAPDSSLPYRSNKIKFVPVPPSGGKNVKQKFSIIKYLPIYMKTIWQELNQTDVVHLRCPANIPLIALVVLFFKKKPLFRWVKYAGNWGNYPKKPLSYRFQRWFLVHNFHRGVVTINGEWVDQPNHVYTFMNPSYSQNELLEASKIAQNKNLSLPLHLLFVGRIIKSKGVNQVIEIARLLKEQEILFDLSLVGDGYERSALEDCVRINGLENQVHFVGWKSIKDLQYFYKVAHFLIFPSTSEGWPKVLSEAMAFGVVPLASDVSSIPQILSETRAGHAFPSNQPDLYVSKILHYLINKNKWKTVSQNGIQAAENFTYETYLNSVRKLFQDNWSIELSHE